MTRKRFFLVHHAFLAEIGSLLDRQESRLEFCHRLTDVNMCLEFFVLSGNRINITGFYGV